MSLAIRETIASRSKTAAEMGSKEKLFTAISILQAHILAQDSALNAEVLFGINHLNSNGLEMAERLLQDLVIDLDDLSVHDQRVVA